MLWLMIKCVQKCFNQREVRHIAQTLHTAQQSGVSVSISPPRFLLNNVRLSSVFTTVPRKLLVRGTLWSQLSEYDDESHVIKSIPRSFKLKAQESTTIHSYCLGFMHRLMDFSNESALFVYQQVCSTISSHLATMLLRASPK